MKGRVQEIWLAWPPMLYQRDGLSWLTSALIKLKKEQEPEGMLRQQERHILVVMGIREDCS